MDEDKVQHCMQNNLESMDIVEDLRILSILGIMVLMEQPFESGIDYH